MNLFLKKLITKFSKSLSINEYTINLKEGNYLLYESIYNLKLVKSEIFKTYIKTNIVKNFILLSKYSAKAFFLFVKKLNNIFFLYIDYQDLNNLTIKNWYLLLLIGKILD